LATAIRASRLIRSRGGIGLSQIGLGLPSRSIAAGPCAIGPLAASGRLTIASISETWRSGVIRSRSVTMTGSPFSRIVPMKAAWPDAGSAK
jgi:hypothetical protein